MRSIHELIANVTQVIRQEGDGFVAICPELDIASEGVSVSEAGDNLCEALGLFFETASSEEISRRLSHEKTQDV